MADSPSVSTPVLLRITRIKLAPALVLLYLLSVLIAMIVLPFWASLWMRTPFMGAFLEHTLVISNAGPTRPGTWALHSQGVVAGSRLVALDGRNVSETGDLLQALSRRKVGEQVQITLQTPHGSTNSYSIVLQSFPLVDRITYFIIPYIIGLVYLVSSGYVFSNRSEDPAGWSFSIFASSVAVAVACLFDVYTTNRLTYLWVLSIGMAGGALFNLAIVFPQESRLAVRYPFLRWIGYLPGSLVSLMAFPTLFNTSQPLAYRAVWQTEFILGGLAAVFFLGLTMRRFFGNSSPILREQARYILWGFSISFLPLLVYFLITLLNARVVFTPFLLLPLLVFPGTVGYAILRYRLLNTEYLLSQAVLYGALSVFAATGYAMLVGGASLILGSALSATNPILVGLMVFFLALFLNPLRARLQRFIEARFFRGQSVYRARLQEFSHELPQALELSAILDLLRRFAQEGIQPAHLHVFVYDALADQYQAAPGEDGRLTSDLQFSSKSALVSLLSSRRGSLFLADPVTLPEALSGERARLSLLGSQLFLALPGRKRLTGWLALGARLSGEAYSRREIDYLETLCDQAALAIERSQVVVDLERRVQEMNVLTRVAQGTNFTINFDDILELIYAQTNHILPARDFRIALFEAETDTVRYSFFLEEDERLRERENQPIRLGQGLESVVIRSQHGLVTDEYRRECRKHGIMAEEQEIYSWMGVPLNAGADTIGVIVLFSRDAAQHFTEEQLHLLQAIADQAAGAIVKSRLLQETESRARQLATLNEIGRSLTSTLEVKPLLNRILTSATEILNCEAGSLFLLDEQTNELVFEVVIGPVAENLVGQRLPQGKGVVGKAVESGEPILVNDVRSHKEWFQQTDQQTGFTTRDLMVVPMKLKERVVGVIEVINKADGSPFDKNDQDLLTTFTSQATIAIENARLYTMTDKALADRLEELSVMQRIDRELNASLDIDRALRVTLEWAMRRSNADAGLVGIVEDQGVRVMAAMGYTGELAAYTDQSSLGAAALGEEQYLPLESGTLRRAIKSGQLEIARFGKSTTGINGSVKSDRQAGADEEIVLLDGAKQQMVAPIRREAHVIGILFLEYKRGEALDEDTLAFISRLSDHAAIAIANAKLYGEVDAANVAKSRFVSFVAHELKNPMSSIKGYTELMAKGMAGPVSEMQASFLSTIHSNVDRMNTIVTDLNDLTKIQVGRLRLEFQSVSIYDVVDEVSRSINRQIEEKEQHLLVELPEGLPPVWVDPARLNQILTNIVSNAHKYTLQGGEIFVSAEASGADDNPSTGVESIHVWIRDNGIGIPPEDQDKIFQQYFRTEVSKDIATGTGLGLNITKSLVEMQGGRIWFESEVDQGTTFHFTVPVAETG
ncbi:MAG: GAF domain-containing protein [Anaerolineales bacterium]